MSDVVYHLLEMPMTVETTAQIWREGQQFVAHAMPIDVMSSGPTPEAARTALDNAVRLFIETARDMGTLNDVLVGCGYNLAGACDWDDEVQL